MHALSIRSDAADTITTACKTIIDGKEQPEKPTTLKRVKNETRVKELISAIPSGAPRASLSKSRGRRRDRRRRQC